MKRIVLSVFAGVVVNALLASAADLLLQSIGFFPPYGQPFFDTTLVLTASAHRALFSVLSAFIVALIAKDKYKRATLVFGIVSSVLWVLGGIGAAGYSPAWYSILGVILSVPYALLGRSLYELKRGRQTVAA